MGYGAYMYMYTVSALTHGKQQLPRTRVHSHISTCTHARDLWIVEWGSAEPSLATAAVAAASQTQMAGDVPTL